MWKRGIAVLFAFAAIVGHAHAADIGDQAGIASKNGTLPFSPDVAWAKPMTDEELSGLRGGFGGLTFSGFFAIFDALEASVGNIAVNTGGVEILNPGALPTGIVEAVTTIGGVPNGFNGIAQMANVVGDFNVVNQNVFLHLNIINVSDAANLQSLTNLLGSTTGTP